MVLEYELDPFGNGEAERWKLLMVKMP